MVPGLASTAASSVQAFPQKQSHTTRPAVFINNPQPWFAGSDVQPNPAEIPAV